MTSEAPMNCKCFLCTWISLKRQWFLLFHRESERKDWRKRQEWGRVLEERGKMKSESPALREELELLSSSLRSCEEESKSVSFSSSSSPSTSHPCWNSPWEKSNRSSAEKSSPTTPLSEFKHQISLPKACWDDFRNGGCGSESVQIEFARRIGLFGCCVEREKRKEKFLILHFIFV